MFSPATHDIRPEQRDTEQKWIDKAVWMAGSLLVRPWLSRQKSYRSKLALIEKEAPVLESLSDDDLKQVAVGLRLELHRHGFRKDIVAKTFALVREVSGRKLGMKHYPVQLLGGWVILDGKIAEMETGEGKTLTANLPAATAALAGVPVHVITVNDYLARRDMELMQPVYEALGLTVSCVHHEMQPMEKRQAYEADIVYTTNKDLTFDYLRDVIALGDRPESLRLQAEYLYKGSTRLNQLLLRGLHFVIVDEADSVLIDEARTPLIISGAEGGDEEEKMLREALGVMEQLEEGVDYRLYWDEQRIELTDDGRLNIKEIADELGPYWRGQVRREELVTQALTATYLFRENEHYLVREGKIEIIDQYTGRVMPDRMWERGLHQLIEIKEDCEVTKQRETQARISYQRFFRRYLRLGGMTGTAKEVRHELWTVYKLSVVRVPTNRKSRRSYWQNRIFLDSDQKWQAVLESVRNLQARGRPVLIGTRSVLASEEVSEVLTEAGLEHQVLNARQDAEEAEIVALASQPGRITVATNMAGRGTDIKLPDEVRENGGLHVLIVQKHEAGRIDRQLAGRCARQGDAGSVEACLSLDDPLFSGGNKAGLSIRLARYLLKKGMPGSERAALYLQRKAQKKLEKIHARARKQMLKSDEQLSQQLSFSGRSE